MLVEADAAAEGRHRRHRRLRAGDQRGADDGHARRRSSARRRRAPSVLTGGHRLTGAGYGDGYFVAPTIIEHVGPNDEISRSELFGPITCLYRVQRLRGGDRARQRLAVRPDGVDPHAEHQPRDDVPQPDPGGRGGGERRHLRQRAAHAVRRAAAVGQRLARGGHAGARRLLGPEDHLHQPQSRAGREATDAAAVQRRRLDSGARQGSQACSGQERPRAGRPSGARLHDRAGARERRLRVGDRLDRLARRLPRSRGTTAPRCRSCGRRQFAGDTSPDIEWLEYTLRELQRQGRSWDCFSLLRPTSPFRTADDDPPRLGAVHRRRTGVDSLRAVEKCAQHPGKMWVVRGDRMVPLLRRSAPGGRSRGTARRTRRCRRSTCRTRRSRSPGRAWCSSGRTIAGDVLVPFLTEGYEGFDINDPARLDDRRAAAGRRRRARCRRLPQPAYPRVRMRHDG